MRLPRLRWTIRLMMFLILMVALLLVGKIWANRMAKRGAYYRQIAKKHAAREQEFLRFIPMLEQSLAGEKWLAAWSSRRAQEYSEPDPWFGDENRRKRDRARWLDRARQDEWEIAASLGQIEHYRAMAAHHASLTRKYEHAAAYPWQTVPPDPPEPTAPAVPPEPANPPAEPERPPDPDRYRRVAAPVISTHFTT